MNRKSEKAVNDAIQYLADLIEITDSMDAAGQAANQIKILQETLRSSAYERKEYR